MSSMQFLDKVEESAIIPSPSVNASYNRSKVCTEKSKFFFIYIHIIQLIKIR